MTSFWRIFWLETLSLVRTKTWAILAAVSVAWMFVLPHVLHGDGTADGARELYVRYSLGGVFFLLVVALVASATGTIASERAAKRLQLTLVRPVRYAVVAIAKGAALLTCGASILALAAAILACRVNCAAPCSHCHSPILPSVADEAKEMYEAYLKDPETPEAVRKAKKSVVLRILTQRALDHYQTIPTNEIVKWSFDGVSEGDALSVRMRFTNQFDMRQELRGVFRVGDSETVVSNMTQAVLTMPLASRGAGSPCELSFENRGDHALMIRPRKDLNLLTAADSFGWNLIRAVTELIAALALVIAFGLFLGSGLGRPVAIFVAFVTLAVGEMSPSVVEQYPDELEAGLVDRVGLVLTRFSASVTHPLSAINPLERLSRDVCIESRDVIRVVAQDLVAIPLLISLLAAFVMPRKVE